MVPRRLKQLGRRDRRVMLLLVDDDETVVVERHGARARLVGSVQTAVPDHEDQVRALVRRAKHLGEQVTVCLSGRLGLRKIVSLPLAARDDLDQLLRFEMDRMTPFRVEEVCFAHRIVDTDPSNRRISVELAVAPKKTVDAALKMAAGVGLAPSRVELGTARADDHDPLNLLPHQAGDRARARRLNRVLILLAVILAIAAVVIPMQRQEARLATLNEQIASTRVEAEASHQLRERLDELSRTGNFLLAEKSRRPMTVDVLAELTRLVPDQAHLIQLYLQDGEVQLHGAAGTASDLISVLEGSPLFRSPQFRSPVTQDGSDERFHLSVELVESE